MKRLALVFGVVTLLLFADGIYLLATHDDVGGDTGVLFGNPNNFLSAGTIVVISALLLLVASVIMWLWGPPRGQRAAAGGKPAHERAAGAVRRTASQA